MPKCPRVRCGSANVVRIDGRPVRFPSWRCVKCGRGFMERAHRLAIIRVHCTEPGKTHLKNIDDPGTFLESYIEFLAKTDPEGTGATFKKYIDEHDPDFYNRVVPPTTHDRDRRRPFDGNDDGMNNTWRTSDKKAETLDSFTAQNTSKQQAN